MAIDNREHIPNNVNLGENRALQRALEHWQPQFLDWWKEMGPLGFADADVYLRTATAVDAQGWASYGVVRMPEYRWGIFLADAVPDRRIGFGDAFGEPVWQQVPGEHRSALRRLIVTQGDTEPASVEQQRLLGHTCPSLYDLRNLFQVNVEEGRHLWAMAYLLHGYFGRDGREEADELLARHSGDLDKPRILGTFNEPIADWLSFFMFTYFTDRDGRFQLKSLAESAFDPLSRTCRFMLAEEAFHMFVGASGITRIVKRTLEVTRALGSDDPAAVHVRDCGTGLGRWNRLIGEAGYDFRFNLPSLRFHRSLGVWAGVQTDPNGRPITDEAWRLRQDDWLPSAGDRAFVGRLMHRVTEPGKMAGWIAPPEIGINNAPFDYEYVRLN